jgi:sugar/nucleoside kinase (ribokinase family)
MWVPKSPPWSTFRPLVEAVRNGQLTVCVGNGLSRLSGMPSWNDLLFSEPVVRDLRQQGIDLRSEIKRGTSILELLDCISDSTRKDLCHRLQMAENQATPNLAHWILFGLLLPVRVYTFNYDRLLNLAIDHIRVTQISPNSAISRVMSPSPVHLHGALTTPSSSLLNSDIALGERSYQRAEKTVTDELVGMLQPNQVILFVGYGHSYEDYDVHRELSRLSAKKHGAFLYSLLSNLESNQILDSRLKRCEIQGIYYSLPENATPNSRILALADSLYELAVCSFGDAIANKRMQPAWRTELTTLREQEDEANRSSTLVIGLSAMHRIAEPRLQSHLKASSYNPYPDGSRKNVGTDETEEPGGPGLIVAKVLSALGMRASLVSSVADDPYGIAIYDSLKSTGNGEMAIDLDHFTVQPSWAEDSSPTWSSYVLLNPKPFGHRTFLDRFIPPRNRPKAGPKVDSAAELMRDDPPRMVYFDKFYKDAVGKLLRHPGGARLSDRVITFYETGSDGDKQNNYAFEDEVVRHLVNVALCSFRFARDFLGVIEGRPTPSYSKNFRVNDYLPDEKESELIDDMLVKNEDTRNEFVAAIRDGARKWLRPKGPRVVIVTLHHFGAIWILVDSQEHELVSTTPSNCYYGFSAGDVFRAGFIAGSIKLDDNTPNFLAVSENLTRITRLANRLARIKVESQSFISCLPEFRRSFTEWST